MGRMEEFLLIAVIALVLFGSSRLPEAGKGLGRAIKEFREALSGKPEESDEKKPSGPPGEKRV